MDIAKLTHDEWTSFHDFARDELEAMYSIDAGDGGCTALDALLAVTRDRRIEYGYRVDGVVYASLDDVPKLIGQPPRGTGLSDVQVVCRLRRCAACKDTGRLPIDDMRSYSVACVRCGVNRD